MSNQGYYDQSQSQEQQQYGSNPFDDPPVQNAPPGYGGAPPVPQGQPQQSQSEGYAPPSGPPPGQAPARAGTFKEADFVPENERGEQREAMEQFELNKSSDMESQHDQDVAQLQREFPGVDGSLIAALYSDNGNMGATRETLQELAQGQAGQ